MGKGNEYGYWVSLPNYKFDEPDGTWVQAMVVGKFQHPEYGEIEITPQRIQQFAANVAANVRGQELDIDYDHKDRSGEAAGWVKGARAVGDKLELLVQWTSEAKQKIADRVYRYFSPEFSDEWEDNQGNRYQDVLFGGALTNRPFLKNMAPINMSEVMQLEQELPPTPTPPPPTPPKPPKEGNMTVALKEVLTLLGLPEDADKDAITKQCSDLMKLKAEKEGSDPLASQAGLMALAEENPALKVILEERAENQRMLEELRKRDRMTMAETKVRKLCSPVSSKIVVTPVLQDNLVHLFTELPDTFHNRLADVVDYFVKGKGVVELGERGFSRYPTTATSEDDPQQALMEAARRIMSERKISLPEALRAASAENALLYEQYRAGAYADADRG